MQKKVGFIVHLYNLNKKNEDPYIKKSLLISIYIKKGFFALYP